MPTTLLNTGIYTVPESSRLARVSMPRIRRWLRGCKAETEDAESEAKVIRPPLWQGQLAPIDGRLALGFLDLIEVRFVDAFLRAGVTWRTVREIHALARNRYGTEQPFCTRHFVTDGSCIFEHLAEEGQGDDMVDAARGQQVFPAVIHPFLKELVFSEDEDEALLSWWPLGRDRLVVLDPARAFGQPVAVRGDVPTEVLFNAVKAGQSSEEVAQWYEVPVESVQDAEIFERSLLVA